MGGWMWLGIATVGTALPALWMWLQCRDKVGAMTDRDLPRWGRASKVLCVALGGATGLMGVTAMQAARAAAGRK